MPEISTFPTVGLCKRGFFGVCASFRRGAPRNQTGSPSPLGTPTPRPGGKKKHTHVHPPRPITHRPVQHPNRRKCRPPDPEDDHQRSNKQRVRPIRNLALDLRLRRFIRTESTTPEKTTTKTDELAKNSRSPSKTTRPKHQPYETHKPTVLLHDKLEL